ncbi:cadmium-translocating P-type ATPase [Asaia siamensis]|uniref:Copper-translocating P-type ATPase n=1 Tax=Asaia siamensis TaxID=110479 RepID=A0ABQ1MJE0_9PROT|nr:heavy metal translocating P-type ATPase [Asaia siamensis]GBR06702.1 cation/heavy metal transporter [Asaia siamensis NRIC 0323]GGC40000.1 copper-translocating P-type ATPase [Asaia siamensis]
MSLQTLDLEVTGMSCAACAARLEKVLNRQTGLEAVVNFASSRAVITRAEGAPDLSAIEKLVEKTGFGLAHSEVTLSIGGMSCAACSARVEKILNRLPGVTASVNLATEQALVRVINGAADEAVLMRAIEKAGFSAAPVQEQTPSRKNGSEQRRAVIDLAITALFCLPFLIGMIGMAVGRHDLVPLWLQGICASVVQIYSARHFYRSAWHALRTGSANMNVLVCLGTSIAYGFSVIVTVFDIDLPVYFEASAFVILLVSVGRLLEARARHRAAAGLEALLTLKPETANRVEEDRIIVCPVASLRSGDVFLLRPGEAVPVDGEVIDGETEINESMLTGEANPVLRRSGDTIYAGTLNTTGILRARATSLGADTALARIVALVSRAQGSKAPIQRLADRVSAVFVPTIIVIALLTFFIGWAVTGSMSWSLVSAISVLVIACPCSLGLATPTALMVGTGKAASVGILFRNAEALERACRLTVLAFDKTGTITLGEPCVHDILPSADMTAEALLTLAAALEVNSEHPLGRAIVAEAKARGLDRPMSFERFRAVPGKGIEAWLGEDRYLIGTNGYLVSEEVVGASEIVPESAATQAFVARNGSCLGVITLTDRIRPEAGAIMDWLHESNIRSVMLTGDSQVMAETIAKEVGIDQILASLRPEGKVAAIEALRGPGQVIGMTGDGINDAPALAAADISIAIGSGSAAALETADLVLMSADLRAIQDALSLSRATVRKIKQNLGFAFGYNLAAIPLAACGFLSPAIAGGAMALSSVSVVTNSLLLNRWRSQRMLTRSSRGI